MNTNNANMPGQILKYRCNSLVLNAIISFIHYICAAIGPRIRTRCFHGAGAVRGSPRGHWPRVRTRCFHGLVFCKARREWHSHVLTRGQWPRDGRQWHLEIPYPWIFAWSSFARSTTSIHSASASSEIYLIFASSCSYRRS